MKLPMRLAVILTLLAVTGGPVLASCEKNKRIHPEKVPCMEGGYKNKSNSFWNPRWEAWARNLCSDRGKIVVKVDVKNGKDKTWYLTGSERKDSGYGRVRGVYYCKDLSHPDTRPSSSSFNISSPDWLPPIPG